MSPSLANALATSIDPRHETEEALLPVLTLISQCASARG